MITRKQAIGCLRTAVDLAGDGGFQLFTDEEYKEMTKIINELLEQENNKKEYVNEVANKELQETLKQYPDNAIVVVEYCNLKQIVYIQERNLITID